MTSSYTELQQYWKCPRSLGFRKLGYQAISQPKAMAAGTFVHEGLRAYFAGGALDTEWAYQAVRRAKEEAIIRLDKVTDKIERLKLLSENVEASNRAIALLSNYFSRPNEYSGPVPELEAHFGKCMCHLDLSCTYKDRHAIVDFKPSKSPDLRAYDFGGQGDLSAYVIEQGYPPDHIYYVIYDVISDEGIFKHVRQPRREVGEYLFIEIEKLADLTIKDLLAAPHPQWNCPQCEWFTPCWLWATGEPSGAIEHMEANYLKRSGSL